MKHVFTRSWFIALVCLVFIFQMVIVPTEAMAKWHPQELDYGSNSTTTVIVIVSVAVVAAVVFFAVLKKSKDKDDDKSEKSEESEETSRLLEKDQLLVKSVSSQKEKQRPNLSLYLDYDQIDKTLPERQVALTMPEKSIKFGVSMSF